MRKTGKDKRKHLVDATRQMNNGKYAEAERILSDLLTSYPGDPEVCRSLATLHLKRGQLQVALSEIKFLATAAMRAQDYALAQSMIEEYLQVDPTCAPLMAVLGEIFEDKGDRPAAVNQYVRIIELLLTRPDPDYPDLARELYEKIKTLSPGQAVPERLSAAFAAAEQPAAVAPPSEQGEISSVVSLDSEQYRHLVAPPSQRPPLKLTPPPPSAAVDDEPATQAEEASQWQAAQDMAPAEAAPAAEPDTSTPEVEEPSPTSWAPEPAPEPIVSSSRGPVWTPPPSPEASVLSASPPPETTWAPEAPDPSAELEVEEEPPVLQELSGGSAPQLSSVPALGDEDPVGYEARRPRTRRAKPSAATDLRARYLRSRLSRWVKKAVAAAAFTGRLTVLLLLLGVALPVLAVLAVTVTWVVLEEKPSPTFQTLATVPIPEVPDPRGNGYFLLLGLAEPPLVDPMRAGYERWQQVTVRRPPCVDPTEERDRVLLAGADGQALAVWRVGASPTRLFEQGRPAFSGWAARNEHLLARYERWLTMPFEDAGYATTTSLDCAQILAVHRLYLAAGFAHSQDEGLGRLELDLAAWRNVLGHAKTLTTKRLALRAVDDDVVVLSDLLARVDLDSKHLPRLSRLSQPLTPAEQSLRAAMQDEFLAHVRLRERRLQAEDIERPMLAQAAIYLPLPKQRVLNGHAAYYEALMKLAEGRPRLFPPLYDYAQSPPQRWLDYLVNPVDNLVSTQPLPSWNDYAGMVLETDARLRLAGLQAHLHVPPRHAVDLLGRIAEAGPRFYDPFTDLPMLTNPDKTVLYSIGRDRADNNGDPRLDVVVPVFSAVPAS